MWVADGAAGRRRVPSGPLGGVPLAVKDLFCTEGVPSQAGSRILEGYRPPYTATVVAQAHRGRRAAAGQDQPGRVRDGLVERELRLRAGAQPVGPHARPGRLLGRQRRGGRGRPRAVGDSAPTPAARSASPPRCAASSGSSRPTARLALRHDRVRLLARPGRPADARRDRRRAAARAHGRAATSCDSTSLEFPEAIAAAQRARTSTGMRLGVPEELLGGRGRHRARRARSVRGDARSSPSGSGRSSSRAAAARAARAVGLLPDRAGRGLVEPRALRRRPLRAARRRRRPT